MSTRFSGSPYPPLWPTGAVYLANGCIILKCESTIPHPQLGGNASALQARGQRWPRGIFLRGERAGGSLFVVVGSAASGGASARRSSRPVRLLRGHAPKKLAFSLVAISFLFSDSTAPHLRGREKQNPCFCSRPQGVQDRMRSLWPRLCCAGLWPDVLSRSGGASRGR